MDAVIKLWNVGQVIALLEGLIPEDQFQVSRDNQRSQSPTHSLMGAEALIDDTELIDFEVKLETEAAAACAALSAEWTLHLKRLYIFSLVRSWFSLSFSLSLSLSLFLSYDSLLYRVLPLR